MKIVKNNKENKEKDMNKIQCIWCGSHVAISDIFYQPDGTPQCPVCYGDDAFRMASK